MVKHLLPLIALLGAPVAEAAYATLAMPVGMSAPAVGSPYSLYNVANATYKGGYYLTQAVLNLGARQVTIPMAFRVAGAASYLAAGAIAPYVSVAFLAYEAYPYVRDWLARDTGSPSLVFDDATQTIMVAATESPYTNAQVQGFPVNSWGANTMGELHSPPASCPGTIDVQTTSIACGGPRGMGTFVVYSCNPMWDNGWSGFACGNPGWVPPSRSTPGGPASASRVADLAQSPVDPRLLPPLGISVPVDPTPVINPADFADSPALVGPAGNTAPVIESRPFAVPNGEPIAVPNTNPVQYVQPWWEVTPAPTVQDPYRVQVVSTTTTIVIDRPVITAPPPIVPLTCDLFPNSLGCIPLAPIPDPEPVPQVDRAITLQAGPALSGGACPPDLVLSVHGTTITVPAMATACSWISMARPVILLLAALSAIAIVRPGGGKNAKPA